MSSMTILRDAGNSIYGRTLMSKVSRKTSKVNLYEPVPKTDTGGPV